MEFTTVIDLLDAGKRPTHIVEHATSGLEQSIVESVLRDLPNVMKRRFSNLTAPIVRQTIFGPRLNVQAAGRAIFQVQPMPPAPPPAYLKEDDDS